MCSMKKPNRESPDRSEKEREGRVWGWRQREWSRHNEGGVLPTSSPWFPAYPGQQRRWHISGEWVSQREQTSTQPYPSQAPITLSEACQFLNHTQPALKHTHLPIRFLNLTFASKQKTKNSRDWRKASSRKDKSKLKNKKRRETEALQWAEKNFEIYLIKLLRKLRHYINKMSMNREQ